MFVALAGLWLRRYTRDRREVWLANSSSETVVFVLNEDAHTLLAGEVEPTRAPPGPSFALDVQTSRGHMTTTVTRALDRQEVLIIDTSTRAAYAVLDMTPRFAANGTRARRRLSLDGRSFRPDVVQIRSPATVVRLAGGAAATIGPLERLPEAVWLARKYGRSVHKIFRLPPGFDVTLLQQDVEQALADQRPLVPLELPITPQR